MGIRIKAKGYMPALSGGVSVPLAEEGVRLLKDISLFEDFSQEELKEIYPKLNPSIRRIGKEDSIAQFEDDDEQLSIVLYGGLTEYQYADGKYVRGRCKYGPGSLIGIDILSGKDGTSEIKADTECKLLFISVRWLLNHERYGLRFKNSLTQLQSKKNAAYPI